jgi:hypothetical protein
MDRLHVEEIFPKPRGLDESVVFNTTSKEPGGSGKNQDFIIVIPPQASNIKETRGVSCRSAVCDTSRVNTYEQGDVSVVSQNDILIVPISP